MSCFTPLIPGDGRRGTYVSVRAILVYYPVGVKKSYMRTLGLKIVLHSYPK